MGFHDLVSATEAATLSGVSVATLQRFAEVGYLNVESDSDGVPLYSKRELEGVFGLSLSARTPSAGISAPSKPSAASTQGASYSAGIPAPGNGRLASPSGSTSKANGSSNQIDSLFGLLGKKDQPGAQTRSTLKRNGPHTTGVSEHHTNPNAALINTFTTSDAPVAPSPTPAASVGIIEELSAENRKLRHVLDLQERILGIRESEIRDLKEQRDWLRQRLERLEEKSDRDQLLLLSETQTIRKLISLNENKKSNFQLALEWLGLKTSSQGSDQTIEIRSNPSIHQANHNAQRSSSTTSRGSGPTSTHAQARQANSTDRAA